MHYKYSNFCLQQQSIVNSRSKEQFLALSTSCFKFEPREVKFKFQFLQILKSKSEEILKLYEEYETSTEEVQADIGESFEDKFCDLTDRMVHLKTKISNYLSFT